jgi:hypothetical protein
MKLFILLTALSVLTLSNSDCNKKETVKYKGRLEVKAICMNYTISVIEGDMDASKIVANWTDESTKKEYKDVFKLGSPCSFPASIKEGDEFYFIIDTSTVQNCAVCMAYYPVPPKSLPIKVLDK